MFEGDFSVPLPLPAQMLSVDFGPDPMVGMYARDLTTDILVATRGAVAAEEVLAAPSLKGLLHVMQLDSLPADPSLLDTLMLTTSSHAILPSEDPGLTTSVEFTEGESPPDDEIVVTGKRPKTAVDEEPDVPDVGGGSGTDTPGTGGGGGDEGGGEPSSDDPLDCRDREALDAQSDLNSQPDKNTHENGVILYRDANGQVQKSEIVQGDPLGIPQAAWEAEMSRLGISRANVIGIVHNHPAYEYSDYPELQRYPSGGDVPGGDWDAADWFVRGGAGGSDGSGFALYVLDTGGHMREFEYNKKEFYKDLDQEQRMSGAGLPDTMRSDGSSC